MSANRKRQVQRTVPGFIPEAIITPATGERTHQAIAALNPIARSTCDFFKLFEAGHESLHLANAMDLVQVRAAADKILAVLVLSHAPITAMG